MIGIFFMNNHESSVGAAPPLDLERLLAHHPDAFQKNRARLEALHALGTAKTLEQRAYERPRNDAVPAIIAARQGVDRAIQRTTRYLVGVLVISGAVLAGHPAAFAGEQSSERSTHTFNEAEQEGELTRAMEQDLIRFMIDRTRFFLEREFPKNPELATQPEFIAAFVQTQLRHYFEDEDPNALAVKMRMARLVSLVTDEVIGQYAVSPDVVFEAKKVELKKE